mgnify:CR=1 FL=1
MQSAEINQYLQKVFTGIFHLERQVSWPFVSIIGRAAFTPVENNIFLFDEWGVYELNGQKQSFYQQRFFVFQQDVFLIQKNNRSPLHMFPYADAQKQKSFVFLHQHLCGKDVYKVSLEILDKNVFHMNYNVVSPRNPYKVLSSYRKD